MELKITPMTANKMIGLINAWVAPEDCSCAKILPPTTFPIHDCQKAANDPGAIPKIENPIAPKKNLKQIIPIITRTKSRIIILLDSA